MPLSRLTTVLIALAVSGAPLWAQAAPAPSLTLIGETGTAKTLSMAELQALPQVEVTTYTRDSAKIVFRGPSVRSLMTLAGAPTGRSLRGPSMLLAVLAESPDGYRVGFMLAEIDEQFGARQAIVALSQNNGALDAKDGPLRVVIAGEEHRARWIRQITRLRLIRIGS